MSSTPENTFSCGECLLGDLVGALIIMGVLQDPSHPANIAAYFLLGKAAVVDGPKYGFEIIKRSVSQALHQTFQRPHSEEAR